MMRLCEGSHPISRHAYAPVGVRAMRGYAREGFHIVKR